MLSDDIAIVGLSFKLPAGVDDEASFQHVLASRQSLMTAWPESRLNMDAFYNADPSRINKLHARGAHFLKDDPGAFDAPFFSITAKEAAAMDPQQRMVLETSYRAFENAGFPIEQVRGSKTAVFSASFSDDYARIVGKDPDNFPKTVVTGTALSILANRVSWYFDLLGPSIQVDTACSSSLVAVDLACQSLRNGNASMALVTGSNVILTPERSAELSNLGFLSPDSVCYSFDHRANGYSRGEGVIAMVLKPVSQAVRDKDMIRAVIRATGTNQDGKTPSLTQPNASSQEALIRSVYEKAGLDFGAVRYFEAHGTATPVGDPLEMAGMLKSTLVIEKGVILPNALFEKINPEIDTDFYNTKISLVELLKSFNVVPTMVVGHSSGEIAAAYTAGALSLVSACKVSYYRGQLAGKLRAATVSCPGAMISVNLAPGDVQGYLESAGLPDISVVRVACINSPVNCTLSGSEDAIDNIQEQLDRDGIFCKKLKTGVAYHSAAMQLIASEYRSLMGSLETGEKTGRTQVPMVSSVTGSNVALLSLSSPQYWVDNMVLPVRFSDAIQTISQTVSEISDFIEIGPHPALRRPVLDTLNHKAQSQEKGAVRYHCVLNRSQSALRSVLELLGSIFCYGYPVSIQAGNQQNADQNFIPFLVDCPGYPFDHSRTYWAESRFSRDYRLRENACDILGSRVSDWNPLEPKWRNTLSVETWPWIDNHVVSDTILFPGMGLLAMAFEAVKEASPTNREIIGYHIKEANFLSPVIISKSSEEQTEIITRLQRLQKPYEKESLWSEVTISTYFNGQWSECFRARIMIQYEESSQHMKKGVERRLAHAHILEDYGRATRSCTRPVDRQVFYQFCTDHGVKYGEWFQLLDDIRWDGNDIAIARVDVSEKHQSATIAHPAILDSAVQLLSVPSTKVSSRSSTMVPYQLFDGWISTSGWKGPRASLKYLAKANPQPGALNSEGSICVVKDDGSILCNFQKFVLKPIATNDLGQLQDEKPLYTIEWNPQLSLLESPQLQQLCHTSFFTEEVTDRELFRKKLDSTLGKVICSTYEQLSNGKLGMVPASLQKYVSWMEHYIEHTSTRFIDDQDNNSLEPLLQELEEMYPPFKIFPVIARHLMSILCGETDPLQLVFDTGVAETLYADVFDAISDSRFRELIQLVVHEKPNLRILEVGAGTGEWTKRVLSALQEYERRTGANAFSEYTYTDISGALFQKAEQKFQETRLCFKIFDLEQHAVNQGFDLGAYDLVIAGSVLHATSNLTKTIQNVRSLLKPGGHLINVEIVRPEKVETNFAFGVLPGWWLGTEKWRALCPGIDETRWDALLRENGFSGNDLVIRDHKSDICHAFSLMFSTAIKATSEAVPGSHALLVIDSRSSRQAALAEKLEHDLLETSGYTADLVHFNLLQASHVEAADIAISLLELDQSLLAEPSATEFESLKLLAMGVQRLLWIAWCSVDNHIYPYYSLMQGFFRSLRSEAAEKHIVTLAIESQERCIDTGVCAGYISKAFQAAFEAGSSEIEYIVRDGAITSGRLVQERLLEEKVRSFVSPKTREEPWSSGPPLKLVVGTPGLLDTIRLVQDATHQLELDPEEIEVETKAWVGSEHKKQLLMDGFGIPEDHIFYSRNTDFSMGIKRMTKGSGVNVVLNSLSGDSLLASWECIAPFGRFIEIGKSDVVSNSALPMANFAKNVCFCAVDLYHVAQSDPDLCGSLLTNVMSLIAQGLVQHPMPLHVYSVSDAVDAFRYLQSGKNTGRIILNVTQTDVVEKFTCQESTWKFDQNASYLISGGFGGLGRTITRWMARKGARNLIIPSRTGPSSQAAEKMITELTTEGIKIAAPQCDSSSSDSLAIVLRDYADTMPPIKGCINASMVLQDAIFDNMTHAQWNLTVKSKVDTSWNLHQLLPGLDFFIQLSSLAGIYGSIAQSNYAAGCAFQDALARYRISRGEKAVSFDLGWMYTSGVIAENEMYRRQREQAADMRKIEDSELEALLEIYCDPTLPLLSVSQSQVLVGALTPVEQLAKGLLSVGPAQHRPLFVGFSQDISTSKNDISDESTEDPARLFRLVDGPQERASVVVKALASRLAQAISISADDVDYTKPLAEYGVDSLMAVELRNWIGANFKAQVAVFEIMGGATDFAAIGDLVVTRSELS
ncbi:hypothetical protein DL768_010620 [Monosporascus sp. mg162]|nr:hypothetical protein DL768_010620 [Monosporascus sp. mg162]